MANDDDGGVTGDDDDYDDDGGDSDLFIKNMFPKSKVSKGRGGLVVSGEPYCVLGCLCVV